MQAIARFHRGETLQAALTWRSWWRRILLYGATYRRVPRGIASAASYGTVTQGSDRAGLGDNTRACFLPQGSRYREPINFAH